MTSKQKAALDNLSNEVIADVMVDFPSTQWGMSKAFFAVAVCEETRLVDPVELYDYCAARLRLQVLKNYNKLRTDE